MPRIPMEVKKAARKKYAQEYRAKMVAEGRCVGCQNKAAPGLTRCTRCVLRQRDLSRLSRYRRLVPREEWPAEIEELYQENVKRNHGNVRHVKREMKQDAEC